MHSLDWTNKWFVGIVTSVIGGLILAVLFGINDTVQRAELGGDLSAEETYVEDIPINGSISNEGRQTQVEAIVVNEQQCNTMITEIRTVPHNSRADSLVEEIVSQLINGSRNVSEVQRDASLECAGKLVNYSRSNSTNDRTLITIIAENIQADRCGAARSLAARLKSNSRQSEQRAKVALACMGRD